jgi:hypothetical protein
MKSLKFFHVLILISLICRVGLCAEEDIRLPHKVSLWADAGKPFGEVNATLERTNPGRTQSGKGAVVAITLVVKGKTFTVPPISFPELPQPLIHTAEIRTGGARDGGSPWLLLVFRVEATQQYGESHEVYIRFRDGKLQQSISRQRFTFPAKK